MGEDQAGTSVSLSPVDYDYAGQSVSLSSDGKTLAIGASGGSGTGRVRVYRLFGSDDSWTWTQVGKDINGVNAYDFAGSSIALSLDGNVVAVGSPENDDNGNDSGHVRVFAV